MQLTPARLFGVLLRGWWILLIAGVLGGVGAFAYSSTQTPIYHSSSSTYFSMRSGTSGSDINQGSTYTQNQMLSFAQLAMSATVLEPVAAELGDGITITDLRRMTSVSIPQNTVILEITAASSDPERASDIANGIADSLASAVAEVAPTDTEGTATVVARVVGPAVPATVQSSPNKQRDALLGAFAGVLLAGLVLTIVALVDTRVRSEGVLRRVTKLPLLGAIPERKRRSRAPVLSVEPNGPSAEAYRGLRSSLRFAAVEHRITAMAVTSSIPGEGKTTTAVNLALTYAEAGMRVLLVDADLRRPKVAETLGIENSVGLTTMLVGQVGFDEARLTWGENNLWVLPAGEVAPNPAELLASARMAQVLRDLRNEVDIMIVDTAPLLSVADATVLAQVVDTTIVVVDVRRTRIAQLHRALTSLAGVGAELAGVVFTHAKRRGKDDYYYTTERASAGVAPAPGLTRRGARKAQESVPGSA